jgi:hypothetical protein
MAAGAEVLPCGRGAYVYDEQVRVRRILERLAAVE